MSIEWEQNYRVTVTPPQNLLLPKFRLSAITVLHGHRDRDLHLDLEEIVVLLLDLKVSRIPKF